jgi:anti-anti-sigma factor
VAKDSYLVQRVDRQAVVTLPQRIDVPGTGQIREELLTVISCRAAALIADMIATLSCEHAGADAVARACQRALANSTQLRLVATAHIVRRVLSLNGLDRLIPIYPVWKRRSPPQ